MKRHSALAGGVAARDSGVVGEVRRHRRWPWILLIIGALLVGLFYIGGGWYFSNMVYSDALKANPFNPEGLWRGTVQQFGGATITVLPGEEHRDETKFDGAVMGLTLDDGSVVVVGPATVATDGTRTMPVLDVVGQPPAGGDSYRLTPSVWLTAESAGLDAADVTITTPAGEEFPAWEVTVAGSDKWAVLTHGRSGDRHDMLRMARPLQGAGYNLLFTTVAGDTGAPPAEDGMLHYGVTEWDELEAAVGHVLDKGAQTLLLGGVSQGGAATLGFLATSTLADQVDAVILDTPASSLEDIIDEVAEFRTLPVGGLPIPESLEESAQWLTSLRFGVDFSAIDYTDTAGLIDVPLLTFQGSADRTIPPAVNDRFMTTGSGQDGDYVVVQGADHPLSWNADPAGYESKITQFVEQIG
jgi:esterase/lipase